MTAHVVDTFHPDAFLEVDTASPGGRFWTGESRLFFQFVGNNEFSDAGSAEYNAQDVVGRSESYQAYSRTATREISLSLAFMAQGTNGSTEDGILEEVKKKVDWCRALTYPRYVGAYTYPPPVCYVHFGRMYTASGIPLRVLVQGAEVTYNTQEAPLGVETLVPYAATVDLSFLCVSIEGTFGRMTDSATILRGEF